MKIEDMIIDLELEALANGKSHDEAMNAIVEVGKIADRQIDDYESMAKLCIEESKMEHEANIQLMEEQQIYIACTILFGLSTMILAGILAYVS